MSNTNEIEYECVVCFLGAALSYKARRSIASRVGFFLVNKPKSPWQLR